MEDESEEYVSECDMDLSVVDDDTYEDTKDYTDDHTDGYTDDEDWDSSFTEETSQQSFGFRGEPLLYPTYAALVKSKPASYTIPILRVEIKLFGRKKCIDDFVSAEIRTLNLKALESRLDSYYANRLAQFKELRVELDEMEWA